MKRIIAPKTNTVKCCKHVIAVKRENGIYTKCRYCKEWIKVASLDSKSELFTQEEEQSIMNDLKATFAEEEKTFGYIGYHKKREAAAVPAEAPAEHGEKSETIKGE